MSQLIGSSSNYLYSSFDNPDKMLQSWFFIKLKAWLMWKFSKTARSL